MRKIDASARASRNGTVLEFGLVATLLMTALAASVQGLGTEVIGSVSNMVANLRAS
jgi:Flp pilus assembly pilin Flp